MRSFFSTHSAGGVESTQCGDISPILDGLDGGRRDGELSFELRLRRARLGLLVGSIAILMVFLSLTSAYIMRQGLPTFDPQTNTLVRDWFSVRMPGLLFVNTLILLLSSGTMELARRRLIWQTGSNGTIGRESGLPWLAMTILLGLSFLVGQWTVWRELSAKGLYISTNPSSSFFYLLTGMHGVHLFGGVLALLVAGGAAFLRRPVESRAIVVDAASWYWHFMTVLWVYILCLLEFAR